MEWVRYFIQSYLIIFYITCSEIKIISKLVLIKIENFDKTITDKLDKEMKEFVLSLNLSNLSEELWDGLKFDLKAD